MEKKFVFNDELFDDELELEELNEQCSCPRSRYPYLTEIDFYPPSDNRVWESYIEDIDGGDNFTDYCSYIFKILNDEDYFED